MKFLKFLFATFIITLALSSVGVNAANYLVLNEVAIAMKQQPKVSVTDKNETSDQYVINTTTAHSREFQASLKGYDIYGTSCETSYKNLGKNTWVTLGDNTLVGCGTTPVNGKAFLQIRTRNSYTDTTFFWGTWITTKTMYEQYT